MINVSSENVELIKVARLLEDYLIKETSNKVKSIL